MGMYLASMLALGGLLWFYYVIPGNNFNSKCDHYLRLDGLVISGMKFVLFPGESFIKSKNISITVCSLSFFLLVWGYSSEFDRHLAWSSKQAQVENGVDQGKLDSIKTVSLTKFTPLTNQEAKVGWNLRGQTKAISAVAQEVKLDNMFFVDNWIRSLPFEWQLK